jgi:hypothetical protein
LLPLVLIKNKADSVKAVDKKEESSVTAYKEKDDDHTTG